MSEYADSYTAEATSKTPGLVVFLLDVSRSMREPVSGGIKIEIVEQALDSVYRRMLALCTQSYDGKVKDRYLWAIYAYSDEVYDLLDGVKPLSDINMPKMRTFAGTDTALGFEAVERLLKQELPRLPKGSPAPVVCHLTDGQYTEANPEPVVARIKNLRVADGRVLVENIFVDETILGKPIQDLSTWGGILPTTKFSGRNAKYAERLRAMSSPLPKSYQVNMKDAGYPLNDEAVMMLPGTTPDLVKLAFVMAGSSALCG